MDKIRAFIAVELAPNVREALAKIQAALKKAGADVKWVRPENIHITLKFLGYITPEQLKAITEIFPEIYKGIAPFDVALSVLSAFPSANRPRVIWVGLEDKKDQLKIMAERTEREMEKIGFPKEERGFTSHITLGRTRSSKNLPKLAQALQATVLAAPISQTIRKIILFKSILSPSGPTYEPLLTHELTK